MPGPGPGTIRRAPQGLGSGPFARAVAPSPYCSIITIGIAWLPLLALCVNAAEKDQSLSAEERAAFAVQYGDKGADLLRRVLDLAPIADRPAHRKELRENKDMALLLRRKDVQALLADPPTAPDVSRPAASKPRDSK